LWNEVLPSKEIPRAANFFTVGILLFSGSLYGLALSNRAWKFLGPVTPIGGLNFIAGWG